MSAGRGWLYFALITTLSWGIWGALIELPEKNGFPATLGFCVWALTMLVPGIWSFKNAGWRVSTSPKNFLYGMLIGLAGAGGQLILFTSALTLGPAYLIFPIISLSPILTILMSYLFLKERVSKIVWMGIALAVVSIPMLSYSTPESNTGSDLWWLIFALIVFIAWGIQAFYIKLANASMKAEEIFVYMTICGLVLMPVAWWMTDFDQAINYSWSGMYAAAGIQLLNSIGAIALVFALRHGKAIVVSPLTNSAAPLLTVLISLFLYQFIPHVVILIGMVLALVATFFIAYGEEK
ncbi:MAG: EamA family transporter [Reichenbachiella sp.]|uniref:DMT family transporter n=1 Tax=Reichenbachiella sp. TaxID=2184521 RepID=UPI003298A0B9